MGAALAAWASASPGAPAVPDCSSCARAKREHGSKVFMVADTTVIVATERDNTIFISYGRATAIWVAVSSDKYKDHFYSVYGYP